MPHFCKLAQPDTYQACDWDLITDSAGRDAWIRIFDEHTDSYIEHACSSDHPPSEEAIAGYRRAFGEILSRIREQPDAFGRLHIYLLCELRADCSDEYGIGDPYDRVKREENNSALKHLAQVCQAHDACEDAEIVETLFRGVLAGNKFDLGAKDTIELHAGGGLDFFSTLSDLGDRPWFVDDLDHIAPRLARGQCAYKKAIYFIDNAGGDVVLGAIPFARYLADQNCRVVLAANDAPSLNDVTVTELVDLLQEAAKCDHRLAAHLDSEMITTVGTGCNCPLIDLSKVSAACNEAARDCDLLILEGMGRAIETNYHAEFTCDTIWIAMMKNRPLAEYMGCKLYDLFVRFGAAG